MAPHSRFAFHQSDKVIAITRSRLVQNPILMPCPEMIYSMGFKPAELHDQSFQAAENGVAIQPFEASVVCVCVCVLKLHPTSK